MRNTIYKNTKYTIDYCMNFMYNNNLAYFDNSKLRYRIKATECRKYKEGKTILNVCSTQGWIFSDEYRKFLEREHSDECCGEKRDFLEKSYFFNDTPFKYTEKKSYNPFGECRKWYVYGIIFEQYKSAYIGFTTNVENRYRQHCNLTDSGQQVSGIWGFCHRHNLTKKDIPYMTKFAVVDNLKDASLCEQTYMNKYFKELNYHQINNENFAGRTRDYNPYQSWICFTDVNGYKTKDNSLFYQNANEMVFYDIIERSGIFFNDDFFQSKEYNSYIKENINNTELLLEFVKKLLEPKNVLKSECLIQSKIFRFFGKKSDNQTQFGSLFADFYKYYGREFLAIQKIYRILKEQNKEGVIKEFLVDMCV